MRYLSGRTGRVLGRVAIQISAAGDSTSSDPVEPTSGNAAKPAAPARIGIGQPVQLEEHLVPGKTVIFNFTSAFCEPCQRLDPQLRKFHAERANIVVVEVDIDRPGRRTEDWDSPLAQQFNIRSTGLPLLKVYGPNGQLQSDGNAAETLVRGWLE